MADEIEEEHVDNPHVITRAMKRLKDLVTNEKELKNSKLNNEETNELLENRLEFFGLKPGKVVPYLDLNQSEAHLVEI